MTCDEEDETQKPRIWEWVQEMLPSLKRSLFPTSRALSLSHDGLDKLRRSHILRFVAVGGDEGLCSGYASDVVVTDV